MTDAARPRRARGGLADARPGRGDDASVLAHGRSTTRRYVNGQRQPDRRPRVAARLLGVAVGFIGPKVGWGRWTTHGVGALFAGLADPDHRRLGDPARVVGRRRLHGHGRRAPSRPTSTSPGAAAPYTTAGGPLRHRASGAIVWATGQFASYAVFGHRRPLERRDHGGHRPAREHVADVRDQLPYLVVFTGASLFLLIEMHAFDERATWIRRRIGDPGTISSLYLRGGTVFILAAMFGSLLLTQRAASSPLAGAWGPVHDQLVEVGETIGRLLPVGGNVRGGGRHLRVDREDRRAVVRRPTTRRSRPSCPRGREGAALLARGHLRHVRPRRLDPDASRGRRSRRRRRAASLDGTAEDPDPALTHTIKVTVRPDRLRRQRPADARARRRIVNADSRRRA